ncbi:BMP family lipoprotein [Dysosmobacter sp.]|uniref:BMP family lipoprotein n=1 Tax=Dysosmobacter sp. TaxID=2591382 RepID=UPI002A990FC3|nr:BMP family ABC transporter substrate-binding protein [Dysosmobacter sp.]MCI6053778.1 BMP family ABC transporter substrate-binding protein [Dysosmobacter sp.]MDY5510419.1 BMP family ABC transporter substrate-binding protein [Dysosmobacter sp.]
MKKFLALTLALVMALSLVACGGGSDTAQTDEDTAATEDTATDETTTEAPASADDIPDTMTSEDGKYQVAFVTDVGQLKDKSFNQGTFDGVKLYAAANGLSYKYYQPANSSEATDDDRYDAMKAAVDGGAEVVVCAGYLQEAALKRAAMEFPDVPFVFIDGYPLTDDDGNVLANVAGISFQEEQAGYLAGFAAVKDGFTKLGFSGGGGGTNDACCRFGYGYVQGANAAAEELGVTVDMNYSWEYGATFSASTELQTMISGWYANGTEIVFACGGSMFQSIAAAASANDGYVIGVDVDQSGESDYVVTSAMKGLSDAVQWAVGHVYDGTFSEIGGTGTSLGVKDNAVALPTAEGSWRFETFTVEEYEDLYQQMLDGTLVVDNDFSKLETTEWSNVNLSII